MSGNNTKRRLSRKSSIVKDTQVIRDLLATYLKKFIIEDKSSFFLYLSKPNIKLLSLFILSTIKLDDSEKRMLYQVILKSGHMDDGNEQLKMFFKILNGVIDIYPIIYDRNQMTMLDFISVNYINILCEYNNSEESYEILFNVRKIVRDMFDRNCNVVNLFKNDTYLFENVFRSGNVILDYINKKQHHSNNTSSSYPRNSYARNSYRN